MAYWSRAKPSVIIGRRQRASPAPVEAASPEPTMTKRQDHDAQAVRGGPNGSLSLTGARENYARIRACRQQDLPHVRLARPDEEPTS